MIDLVFKDKKIECRSEYSEITLGELDYIVNLLNGPNPYENWSQVLSILSGLTQTQILTWSAKDFIGLTKLLLPLDSIPLEYNPTTVTVGDVAFVHIPRDLTARDVAAIHLAYASEFKLSLVAAVLFKRSQDQEQDYDWEAIQKRAELLSQLPSDTFLPHLYRVTQNIVTLLNKNLPEHAPTSLN